MRSSSYASAAQSASAGGDPHASVMVVLIASVLAQRQLLVWARTRRARVRRLAWFRAGPEPLRVALSKHGIHRREFLECMLDREAAPLRDSQGFVVKGIGEVRSPANNRITFVRAAEVPRQQD